MRVLFLLLHLFPLVLPQGFGNILSAFLGSGLGGNNPGPAPPPSAPAPASSPFAGLLQTFAGTGNNAGPGSNLPFADFARLGAGLLNKPNQKQSPAAQAVQAFFAAPPTPPPASPPMGYNGGALYDQSGGPIAVGRSMMSQFNPAYYRPNARTFVNNGVTGPPIKAFVPKPIQAQVSRFADPFLAPTPVTPAPLLPPGPTLPPPELPKSDPKLLAHNAARMIREIATFSDVHHGDQGDYSSVQSLMEAFFQAVAEPPKAGAPLADQPGRRRPSLRAVRDGTEMGANRPLTNKLFESDMVLTVEQMKGVVLASQQIRAGGGRFKRKVITGGIYRWPRAPIPYKFKEGDEKWRNLIRSALKLWESETCVRWAENAIGKDHVIFFRGSGCYSSVGRTGGSQMISIGYGCEDRGIVSHEVGHSLGFWHEQSRPDRDNYIHLNKQWIIRGTDGNFERRTTQEIEDMGLPYDLGSVMHYGPNAFTKDWDEITIQTKDKNYQRTIGQREGPSFIDVKQVNRLYCHDICHSNPGCQNGGYPDPNNCQRCKCPPGLGGPTCQEIPQSEAACGGELVASAIWQELGHRGKKKCFWRIRANNARIRFILSNVTYRCETTCKAFVEIKHNSDFQQTGFRTCCQDEVTTTSEQSEILIMTESSILDYETGFNLRYIQDSGQPLPKPPPAVWVPGQENRGFRGGAATGGTVEKFILNVIPKIRDPHRPLESIASIVTEYSLASLLGIRNKRK